MPDLISNTQAQNSTTSNGGTNKQPKLDANSFYFLEDAIFTQTAAQAFGVVSENEFRTTSLLNLGTVDKKIFSICSGQIFLQPMTDDAAKVNLILKPYKQPVNGLSIKYFIYRGLPKSQFIESNGDVVPTGTNGLITHIRNEFTSFYNQIPNEPIPVFQAKFIGYPDSITPQLETQLIDSYFYKISASYDGDDSNLVDPDKNFEFPMIPAGTHLASCSGVIGLDIVLNNGDYYIENDTNPFQFNLAFARASANVINVSTATDNYQEKLIRETITQFLDPAAFYGLHANGGKINKFGLTTPITSATDIYNLINSFATKNTIYLYIQSNRQRSYNFYKNYELDSTNLNNIKIGTEELNLALTTFETEKWPVKTFTTAPVVSSLQQNIALQFTTDKGKNTCLYGVMANIISMNSENFIEAKDLIQEPDVNGVISDFTKTVVVSSPIANNENIASIIQLIYLGKDIVLSKNGLDDGDPATPPPDPIYFATKYMDDVFDLINATSFLKADKIYHVHNYKPNLYSQKSIDKNRSLVVAYTQRTQNTIAVSETENLTLFTYLSISEIELSNHSNFSPTPSSNKEATGYGVQDLSEFQVLPNLPSNEFVEMNQFTESGEIINGIKLRSDKKLMATSLVLGISEVENNILNNIINNNFNPTIYFEPILDFENEFISFEKIKYKKYKIALLVDSIDFTQEIIMPQDIDTIYIYTLDGLLFFTKNYAENYKRKEINIYFDEPIIQS